MKVLLQRVRRAAVHVEDQTVASIGRGLCVLLGVEVGDRAGDANYLADKTAELRIFADDEAKMNRSVLDCAGEVLVVSQFTLVASTRRGRRPSFSRAADPAEARRLYETYTDRLRQRGLVVACGVFRAMMQVELVNDGPVTILLDPPPGRGDTGVER